MAPVSRLILYKNLNNIKPSDLFYNEPPSGKPRGIFKDKKHFIPAGSEELEQICRLPVPISFCFRVLDFSCFLFYLFSKSYKIYKTYKEGKSHFHLGNSMKSQIIRQVRQIVLQGLKRYPVEVYFFGSRATGQAGTISDIDVAVNPIIPLPLGLLSRIRQELEESNVPYHVDLVDLSRLGGEWLERIRAEGVQWRD